MAGDWRLYLEALARPGARVAYEARPLNVHRRHAQSVTHALDAGRHVEEIARCHGFAQKALGGGAPRAAQRAYLAEVAAQLGAAATGDPPPGALPPKKAPPPTRAGDAKAKKSKHTRSRRARRHYIGFGYFEGRLGATPDVDERWYLCANPDVGAAVKAGKPASAREHFALAGTGEWRSPSARYEGDAAQWKRALEAV
jgi:hypothetical protein